MSVCLSVCLSVLPSRFWNSPPLLYIIYNVFIFRPPYTQQIYTYLQCISFQYPPYAMYIKSYNYFPFNPYSVYFYGKMEKASRGNGWEDMEVKGSWGGFWFEEVLHLNWLLRNWARYCNGCWARCMWYRILVLNKWDQPYLGKQAKQILAYARLPAIRRS